MTSVILLMLLAMVLTGKVGNLFLGHRGVGRDGRVFKRCKSMVVDAETKLWDYLAEHPEAAEEWERDHKLENDPRITPVGSFLRKTSLDELPQIWNVVRGEMSFVGTRPVVRSELHKYGAHRAAYTSVQPGVTGMWQVAGRNDVSYEERVQLDVDYVKNHNMLLDISLIVRTVTTMLNRTGK